MSNVTITQLPSATIPLSGTEVLPVVQSGTTKQVSVNNLTAGKAVSAASVTATGNISGAALIPSNSTVPTNGMYLGAANTLNFATNTTNRVTIDSSGNVGIGTNAPSGAFGSPVLAIYSASTQARVALKNNISGNAGGDGFQIGISGDTPPIGFLENRENGPITFSTNLSERMRIDNVGNVGIGVTPAAAYILDILKTANSKTAVQIKNTSTGTSAEAGVNVTNGTSTGSFGIKGVSGSSYGTTVAGDTYVYSNSNIAGTGITIMADTVNGIIKFASGGTTERMRIDTSGNIYGTSGTTAMTNGFFYIPAAAGAPSGTPTAVTGRVPMYYDTTNNQFYVYNGAWKKVALA